MLKCQIAPVVCGDGISPGCAWADPAIDCAVLRHPDRRQPQEDRPAPAARACSAALPLDPHSQFPGSGKASAAPHGPEMVDTDRIRPGGPAHGMGFAFSGGVIPFPALPLPGRRAPMTVRTKPFLALTARDLMSRPVVALPRWLTLRAAARRLAREQISGVPVVDAEGRCIGILSATDFLTFWADDARQGDEEVGEHMTADPVMVAPDASITELARMMIDAHIHRVIVVDEQEHPIGVVSSTDVLAAVIYPRHAG
jgi:CBS domain-containing protein